MILVALALNILDVELSWMVIANHGLYAEANPLMAGAFSFGLLGGIAMKSALLAVVLAAAALKPRRARLLLGAVSLAGLVGVISALVA